jgi:hypothetical protein
VLQIHDLQLNQFEVLPLPSWMDHCCRFADLSLVRLVSHYGDPA